MGYKTLLYLGSAGILLGVAVTVLVVHVAPPHRILWGVQPAALEMSRLNAERFAGQCGAWRMTIHEDGEARIGYDASPCAWPPEVKRSIERGNDLIAGASTLGEIYAQIGSIQMIAVKAVVQERSRSFTKGYGQALDHSRLW